MIPSSLVLLPVGIVSLMSDGQTGKKDKEISAFLRSLGGTTTSTQTTPKESLGQLDLDSFPALQTDIKRLLVRLKALIDPELCWDKFGVETGSKLITQACGIFYEATSLGADPEGVGNLCSLFALQTALLRAKRGVVISTFSWLAFVMHATVAGIMIFILEIVHQFTLLLESVMTADMSDQAMQASAMPMMGLGASQMLFLDRTTITMIVLLAVANALAIIGSDGRFKVKATFYLSVLLFMSGVACLVVPPVVVMVLPVGG